MDDTLLKSLELWGSVMCCSNMPVKLCLHSFKLQKYTSVFDPKMELNIYP